MFPKSNDFGVGDRYNIMAAIDIIHSEFSMHVERRYLNLNTSSI